jgi:hypothetical protein
MFFKHGYKIVLYQLYNIKINLDYYIFLYYRKLVCRYKCVFLVILNTSTTLARSFGSRADEDP